LLNKSISYIKKKKDFWIEPKLMIDRVLYMTLNDLKKKKTSQDTDR